MRKLIILSVLATFIAFNNSSARSLIIPSNISVKDPDPAKVKAAVESFKNLSHHESKDRLHLLRQKYQQQLV